jgi:hypothetical protein
MAQKSMPTVLKKQGRRTVVYRDVRGRTYSAIVTNRDSATQQDLLVWMGGTKRVVNNVPVATGGKQTNVYYFRTGH